MTAGTAGSESSPPIPQLCNADAHPFQASEIAVDLDDLTTQTLVSWCGLSQAQLRQGHPDFSLGDPAVRQRVYSWLGSREAQEPGAEELVIGALRATSSFAVATEAPMVRTFLSHPSARVRRAANEYLVHLYFPDASARPCVHQVLDRMTSDEDREVRQAGIRFRERVTEVDGPTIDERLNEDR